MVSPEVQAFTSARPHHKVLACALQADGAVQKKKSEQPQGCPLARTSCQYIELLNIRPLPLRLVFAPRCITAAWSFGQCRNGIATGDSDESGAAATPVPQQSIRHTPKLRTTPM